MYGLEVDDGIACRFFPELQFFLDLIRGLVLEVLVVPVPEDVGVGVPQGIVPVPLLFPDILPRPFELVEVIGCRVQWVFRIWRYQGRSIGIIINDIDLLSYCYRMFPSPSVIMTQDSSKSSWVPPAAR